MVVEQESLGLALTAQKPPDRLLQMRDLQVTAPHCCRHPGELDHPQSEPERLVVVAHRRSLNNPDSLSVVWA